MILFFNSLLIIILACVFIGLVLKIYDIIYSNEAPFVSSPSKLYPQIYKLLEIKPNQTIYDLGCGNGKFLIYCAKHSPKSNFIGIEKGLIPFFISTFNTRRYANIKIYYQDINKFSIMPNSKIFVYLFPKSVTKLIHRLPKNVSLYSLNFPAKGLRPNKKVGLINPTSIAKNLYFYKT